MSLGQLSRRRRAPTSKLLHLSFVLSLLALSALVSPLDCKLVHPDDFEESLPSAYLGTRRPEVQSSTLLPDEIEPIFAIRRHIPVTPAAVPTPSSASTQPSSPSSVPVSAAASEGQVSGSSPVSPESPAQGSSTTPTLATPAPAPEERPAGSSPTVGAESGAAGQTPAISLLRGEAPVSSPGHFFVSQRISRDPLSQAELLRSAHPPPPGSSDNHLVPASESAVLGSPAYRPSSGPGRPEGISAPQPSSAPSGKMSFEWPIRQNRHLLGPAPAPAPLAPAASIAPAPANETYVLEVDATKEEVFASQSILLQIFMLGVAFVVGHVLRRRKFYYIHEASAALLIGLAAGTIGNLYYPQEGFRDWLVFKEDIFMLFLLPPIIFESGFSLQVKPFFDNFGAILTFSLLGTFIAVMVTGVLVYMAGFLFLMYKLSFLESLVFGALISSTDPVTVLAIFQELGADTNLYALVFGESVLNDAMAITMYRTLMSIVANPDATHSLSSAVQYAGITLVGSMSIGMGVALISALLFKYAGLAVHNLHNLECCLIVLFPYLSYLVAEGLAMSGIVAILFCGVVMKRYTFPNLSEMAQTLSAGFFQLISSLAETFTFIYMGSEIALGEEQSWGHVNFIIISIIIIGVARSANVFPCAHLVNLFRPPSKQIPETHQKALWWSGLRGAMAFALALQCVHDLPNESHAKAIFTTTIAIVMVTVLILGGSTATILEKLDVSGEKYKRNTDEEADPLQYTNSYSINGTTEEKQLLTAPADQRTFAGELDLAIPDALKEHLGHLRESASFENLDSKYIRPFFTSASDGSHGHSPSRPLRTNSKKQYNTE